MSELTKQLRRRTIVVSIAYLLLGLLFVCVPDITAKAVAILIAAALLILGIIKTAMYFTMKDYAFADRTGLAVGLLLIIAAIVFFIKPDLLVSIVYILLGLGLIVNGTIKFQAGVELKREGSVYWASIAIAAVIAVILGVLVIFVPFATAKAVTVMVGVSMIACALFDAVSAIFFIK